MKNDTFIELLNLIELNDQFIISLNNFFNYKILKNYIYLIQILNIINEYINNNYFVYNYDINILVIDNKNKDIIYDNFSKILNIEYNFFKNLNDNNDIMQILNLKVKPG